MKKNIAIQGFIYPLFIIVAFFLWIPAIIFALNSLVYCPGGDYYNYCEHGYKYSHYYYDSKYLIVASIFIYIDLPLELISIIGTFVISILMLIKSSNLKKVKGLTKGFSIYNIVGSSISFVLIWLSTFVNSFIFIPILVYLTISYAFNITLFIKYKKENILISKNN